MGFNLEVRSKKPEEERFPIHDFILDFGSKLLNSKFVPFWPHS